MFYKAYCYESEDGYVADDELPDSTLEVLGSANEAILTGLTPYTYYSCHVTANTSIGEGAKSSSVRARTDESSKINSIVLHFNHVQCVVFFLVPAGPPQNLSASVVSANALTVTWSDPDTPYGIIVSYTVTYNLTELMVSLVTESQTATLDGLDEYTIYVIYVAASTRIGTGPYAQVHKRTGQASKPHYAYILYHVTVL